MTKVENHTTRASILASMTVDGAYLAAYPYIKAKAACISSESSTLALSVKKERSLPNQDISSLETKNAHTQIIDGDNYTQQQSVEICLKVCILHSQGNKMSPTEKTILSEERCQSNVLKCTNSHIPDCTTTSNTLHKLHERPPILYHHTNHILLTSSTTGISTTIIRERAICQPATENLASSSDIPL